MHHEGWVPYGQPNGSHKVSLLRFKLLKRSWRRGPGSNRRIKVLQTSPLPLGYRALAGLLKLKFHAAVAIPVRTGGRNGAGDET